jgi:hypothetical protein|tara:strand:+ start:1568 stop:2035 length:468 start_codon:yes stop_codon:yes gene_type:complete
LHYALLVTLTLLFLAFSHSGKAEEPYYIWVDENGVKNFSQRNPKDVDATFVSRSQPFGTRTTAADSRRPPGEPPASESQAATSAVPDADMAEEDQAVQEEIARIRASNCNIGKRNLAKLKAYARIRVGDRVLTDEEKQQRIESAEKTIEDNCGSA